MKWEISSSQNMVQVSHISSIYCSPSLVGEDALSCKDFCRGRLGKLWGGKKSVCSYLLFLHISGIVLALVLWCWGLLLNDTSEWSRKERRRNGTLYSYPSSYSGGISHKSIFLKEIYDLGYVKEIYLIFNMGGYSIRHLKILSYNHEFLSLLNHSHMV